MVTLDLSADGSFLERVIGESVASVALGSEKMNDNKRQPLPIVPRILLLLRLSDISYITTNSLSRDEKGG